LVAHNSDGVSIMPLH